MVGWVVGWLVSESRDRQPALCGSARYLVEEDVGEASSLRLRGQMNEFLEQPPRCLLVGAVKIEFVDT